MTSGCSMTVWDLTCAATKPGRPNRERARFATAQHAHPIDVLEHHEAAGAHPR
jgi:hypothetical protein